MKERPIIMTGESVRAVLAGTKTQTRRLAKWKTYEPGYNVLFSGAELGYYCSGVPESGHVLRSRGAGGAWNDRTKPIFCPHGKVGDRLWIRETFCWAMEGGYFTKGFHYQADGKEVFRDDGQRWRKDGSEASPWISPMRMPREASRLTLEITDIRLQRLHQITEEDAKAEGVVPFFTRFQCISRDQPLTSGELAAEAEHRASFAVTWDEINGDRVTHGEPALWTKNPWVWAISFKRIDATKETP